MKELEQYPDAEVYWVQEEPKNMGAWSYVRERLDTACGGLKKIRFMPHAKHVHVHCVHCTGSINATRTVYHTFEK